MQRRRQHYCRHEPDVVEALRNVFSADDGTYRHLAELGSDLDAGKRQQALHAHPVAWARSAILNIAHSGRFSRERTIAEYADKIWNVTPCPVNLTFDTHRVRAGICAGISRS